MFGFSAMMFQPLIILMSFLAFRAQETMLLMKSNDLD